MIDGNQAKAKPLAGAVAFLQKARSKGVTIFYVTNRAKDQEPATLQNLLVRNFPVETHDKNGCELDVLLMKGENPDWTSDKSTRRVYVSQSYRVIMLFGDDLNDFISAKNLTETERKQAVKKYKSLWAEKWFILPNPLYGSWQSLVQ